jgi:two-component system, NtrC family, response regulator GlrR
MWACDFRSSTAFDACYTCFMLPTEPLKNPATLLRLDRDTGHIKERKYQVTVELGPDAGKSRTIEGKMVIGKHPDAGFPLGDGTVSRYHVELTPKPDGVSVRDLESTNGTYLGGTKITEVLVEGEATFSIGKTSMRISMVESDLGLPDAQPSFGPAIGASQSMKALFGILEKVSPSEATVLLLGETGAGKEILAKAVHLKSKRAHRPFVIFDCTAVDSQNIESELFGHVKGSFPGALNDRNGAFMEADGGTLFLDEIGELPLDLQPKLLRALETGSIKRLGEEQQRRVDVRVIAATNKDLDALIAMNRFRKDLYFRLAVVLLTVPPLRDRLDDLPLLTNYFVKSIGRGDFEVPRALWARFATYHWPGNVRELRNLVERSLAGADVELLEEAVTNPTAQVVVDTDLPFKEAKDKLVDSFTKEYLVALLDKCGGNVSQAAREAGIARNYVHRLVTKLGLKTSD